MAREELLERAQNAFRQQAWKEAYTLLYQADKDNGLKPEDLEILAETTYLLGKFNDSNDIWSRAHNDYLKNDKIEPAVRCAFWLGFTLLNKGESARGSGWIARARSLLNEAQIDSVVQGYLLLPDALMYIKKGDPESSFDTFEQAGKIGKKFQDNNLMTLSRLGRGQTLIRSGKVEEGISLLDEAMVAVESGEIAPIPAGIIYCAVIEACLEIFDLGRAHEWTESLNDWCSSQPHLVPFRGNCLIRRSEIKQLRGEWPDAIKEAQRAIELLSKPKGEPAAGAAYYQLGELQRVGGDFELAEEAYRQASKWGRNPQPGLALLRLAQGQVESAEASIQRTMEEAKNQRTRALALSAYVEVMLSSDNIQEARKAVNELMDISRVLNAPLLTAIATRAEGIVLHAEGDLQSALVKLRNAWNLWEKIKSPYEAARTRFFIGMACQEAGDHDTAKLEYEAAKWTFKQLRAKPDIVRVDSIMNKKMKGKNSGLTKRELEVLQLIADGKSNKAIANELFISERTVERHVSNIFTKLDVSSRSGATAYAYKHDLI